MIMMEHEQLLQEDILTDEDFSYDGYQVVRGEFFAHINEPSITFNQCKFSVNTACIKKLPMVQYIQILIHPEQKKLVIRPCNEDAKDSFLWYTESKGRRKPRQLTCRIFFAKIVNLMNWNPDYRYKLLGKIIRSNDTYLILFDLTAVEIYVREAHGEKRNTNTPKFPAEWKNQFGLPVEDHKHFTQVSVFDEYTVFSVSERKPKSIKTEEAESCQNLETTDQPY